MADHPLRRRRLKSVPEPSPKKKRVSTDESDDQVSLTGISSTAQKLAARHGMYTLATVSKLVGRKPVTIRRWLRFEECPKPTHFVTYNGHYDMMLFTDDDVALLIEWREAQKPGRPRIVSARTERRRPNEPFYRGVQPKSRYIGTKKTLMPRKETPVEYWARIRGNEIETFQHSPDGRNVVTSQRIIHRLDDPTSRRLVKPNAAVKKPTTGEKRRSRPSK